MIKNTMSVDLEDNFFDPSFFTWKNYGSRVIMTLIYLN